MTSIWQSFLLNLGNKNRKQLNFMKESLWKWIGITKITTFNKALKIRSRIVKFVIKIQKVIPPGRFWKFMGDLSNLSKIKNPKKNCSYNFLHKVLNVWKSVYNIEKYKNWWKLFIIYPSTHPYNQAFARVRQILRRKKYPHFWLTYAK